MPQGTGVLGCVQYVGGGGVPRKALHHFQKPGQRCRAHACADTGKKNRQPEARGARTLERGGYCIAGCRWRFGCRNSISAYVLVGAVFLAHEILTSPDYAGLESSQPSRKPARRRPSTI